MTITAIILILISTCLHATWNLIAKSGKPSPLFFLILTLSTVALLTPFLLLNLGGMQTIPTKFWWLLLATGIFETMYYTGLAQAYRHGDISLVYPLIRAVPVLLVPLVCFILGIGKTLSFEAVGGMVLIGVGCVMMPVKSFRTWHIRDYRGTALWWVIPGALGTVGYTIIDSEAISLLNVDAFSVPVNVIYSGFINIAILPWLTLVIIFSSGWKGLKDYRGKKILRPMIASAATCLAYMLILASMKYVTNVSYVAGFRQLSIPFGVILGVMILKEKFFLPRIVGCIIIMTGLVLTAMF
jgi:drug/metabolite transporter (DMT)-like permease